FHVHQNVLASSSEFFKNALKSEWRTDPSKLIDLSDANSWAFEKYSQFLYTKVVPTQGSHTGRAKRLAHLYFFGERIMDDIFKDSIIDAYLVSGVVNQPSIEAIRVIYKGTTTGSPARCLMV
ncbi:hypothetical protein EK21DRAFT_24267, partial [Setomelanomma holmii]